MISSINPITYTTQRQPMRARTGLASNPKLASAPAQQPEQHGTPRRDGTPQWSIYA